MASSLLSVLWVFAFLIGFSFVIVIGYFIIRRRHEGRRRLVECYVIMAVGITVIQLLSLWFGIMMGYALAWYYSINALYSPVPFFMFADVFDQFKKLRRMDN